MPPGAMPPGAMPPPGQPGPGQPPAYGYPQQPAGQPTVGPGYQAVLRYRAQDGSEQQLIRRSAPGTPHPEWQIFHELRAMNVPPDQVLELHTELELSAAVVLRRMIRSSGRRRGSRASRRTVRTTRAGSRVCGNCWSTRASCAGHGPRVGPGAGAVAAGAGGAADPAGGHRAGAGGRVRAGGVRFEQAAGPGRVCRRSWRTRWRRRASDGMPSWAQAQAKERAERWAELDEEYAARAAALDTHHAEAVTRAEGALTEAEQAFADADDSARDQQEEAAARAAELLAEARGHAESVEQEHNECCVSTPSARTTYGHTSTAYTPA
ncbi:hypothetical protein SVIOM74S_00202 [Streptomyces violarus]